MKTLVTGGNGFVAGHIIQKLLAQGDHVIATVRSDEKGQRLMKEFDSDHRLSYVLSSLNDPDDVVLTDACVQLTCCITLQVRLVAGMPMILI